MRTSVTLLAALSVAAWLSPADAQSRLPRCGGWPHHPGQPGLIVAPGGAPCRGALFRTRYRPGRIIDVQVLQPISRGGTLRMLNLSEFVYEPGPGQTGYERFILEVTGEFQGNQRTLPAVYLATTEADYRASGGTDGAPPPGFTESPYHRRRLLMR